MDKIVKYVQEHTLIKYHPPLLEEYVVSEAIVDNPKELIRLCLEKDCYVSNILWWHLIYNKIGSDIGALGGPPLLTDPENRYFAEICWMDDNFPESTTLQEYYEYLEKAKAEYPDHDIYPGLTITKKTGDHSL